MGTRPEELARGLACIAAQSGVELDIVVVGNGWKPTRLPAGVKALHLPENLGIPAGRNRGVAEITGEYLFFLDDDASIPSPGFLAEAIAKLRADPTIGLLQPRVVDPSGTASPTRWIPRIRKGDPARSSNVFSVWEGATLMPRALFEAVGGWGEPYFYAHEGIELAWRVWGAGKRTWYAGDLIAHHPAIDPARHDYYYRLNARNRVWLAKRNLPWVLVPCYVASWTGIQLLRSLRNRTGLRAWFAGWREGWRESPGGRRSIGWVTVWRMTLAGRPPLV
jgi:GT2 family glycosyltransferase